ncbi:exocyst complex component EXO70B1-like [Vigna unguiculata]|uniref:exocyst complex component EXO70B1-like n=1 Tax=Vigna unguiculata TaxID=3917 RepID=UPI001015D1E9|nr:exocyst complex component EXO70B1-like [Vigna unguiculata]
MDEKTKGFTYSLLQLRDYPCDTAEENLQLQEQNQFVIIQLDDTESDDIIKSQQDNSDVDSTLATSPEDEDLRLRDHLLTQSDSHPQDADLIIKQQLMNCMKELEKENERLVPMVCSHVEKYLKAAFDSREVPDPDFNLVMDALPSGIMRRLKENVKLMVDAGFMDECIDIYSKSRKEFVEQCLRPLGLQFEKPNNEDVEKWSKTWKAVGKILFPNERGLCSYIFSGIHDAAGVSAVEKVCKKLTTGLLSFADTTITADNYLPNLLSYMVPKMSETLGEVVREVISPTSDHELSIVDDIQDVRQSLGMLKQSRDSIYPNNDIQDVRQKLAMLNKIGGNLIYPNKKKAGLVDGGFHLMTNLLKKKIRKL